jgi:hypothetical protein
MHFDVFFLLGDSPASEFYVPKFRNTVRSISTGGVSRKNNWDEIARVFIQVKVLTQKKSGPIRRRRDGEGACPSIGTGCGGQWPEVEAYSKTGM